jgi:hypothetical protein
MGTALQQTPFQCDQCGATNVVAAPVVFQQGTHSYSTGFHSGTSQTFAAHIAAPPNPRSYRRPLLMWGFPIGFTFFWGFAGLSRILDHPQSAGTLTSAVALFLILGGALLGGMFLSFRRIARYNRDVYPRLYWNWEHTYICRRCGKSQSIFS